jgi:NAD(P)-dependent dehydrogenase (short-subunit alcohol dehydrogenase family)
MGAEVVARLRAAGRSVVTVDRRDADVVADLATPSGRSAAVREVLDRADGVLHGAVLAAGIGPMPRRERAIAAVNFTAPVELLTSWRHALAAGAAASGVPSKVVVFGSNSASVTPGIPRALVRSFLADRPVLRARLLAAYGGHAPAFAYGGSKLALSRWVRRTAPTAAWAGSGIRLNALAPGAVLTPLLQAQLDGPERRQIEAFPIPTGGFGDPGLIADWAVFMLSPAADFLCGSVVYVDGGTDAWFRADAWPASTSPLGIPRWLRRTREFRRHHPAPARAARSRHQDSRLGRPS